MLGIAVGQWLRILGTAVGQWLRILGTAVAQWLRILGTAVGQWLRILGTAVAQWLRRCAINRKVVGSISDGVIGIFHSHNPSDRTMGLGSTQPLTEMSTRSISWG